MTQKSITQADARKMLKVLKQIDHTQWGDDEDDAIAEGSLVGDLRTIIAKVEGRKKPVLGGGRK